MNTDTTPTPRWVIKKGDFDGKPYLWDDRRYDNYDLWSLCHILNQYEEKTNEVARLRQALELIACPERPDGTYNRGREACELLAKEALKAEIK